VQRGDRRLQGVGPAAAETSRGRGRRGRRDPLASQSERSCSPSRTTLPSAKRASWRASGSSISASRQCTSASRASVRPPPRRAGIASAARSPRPPLALVEDQVDDGEDGRQPIRKRCRGAPERGCRRRGSSFRPHQRFAIVALGRRKAWRSRPWSGRRACAAPGHLRRAARRVAAVEDQLEPFVGKAGLEGVVFHSGSGCGSWRSWRRACARGDAVDRVLRPVTISQARGLRCAVTGPALGPPGRRRPGRLPREVEVAGSRSGSPGPVPTPAGRPLVQLPVRSTTGRTSIAPPIRGRDAGGKLQRRVEVVGLDQVVAAEDLLGGREGRRWSAPGRPRPAPWSPSPPAAAGRRGDAGGLGDRVVLTEDGVLLLLGELPELVHRVARVITSVFASSLLAVNGRS